MAKKQNPSTYVCLVLDHSSSMCGLTGDARQAVNSMLRALREQASQGDHDVYVSLVQFANSASVLAHPQDARNLQEMRSYHANGSTALWDATGLAADTIAGKGSGDVSYLVMAFTDGEENASTRYNQHRLRQLIQDRQNEGNWTFAFQVPKGGYADRLHRAFGIPMECIREWEQTARGVREMEATNTAGLTNFFNVRRAGGQNVSNFYNVTTDLSALSQKKLKSELTDISARFKSWTVQAEASIREFVEEKTKRPYVIGSSFYLLSKPEKIQPDKAVLIMEKGQTAIWGGEEARDLIGLPTDGVTHAKVKPGNHGGYDIYCESRSVNRKLVRGTKVLVDVTMTTDKPSTWDHTTVEAQAAEKAAQEAERLAKEAKEKAAELRKKAKAKAK